LLILAALLTIAEPVGPPPCTGVTPRVDVLGPGPSESNVPLNTRIWMRAEGLSAEHIQVQLREAPGDAPLVAGNTDLYVVRDPFASRVLESGVEGRLPQLLKPNTMYLLEWSAPRNGLSGGHVFITGATVDDTPPLPAVAAGAAQGTTAIDCDAAIGLQIDVGGFDAESLLHVASIDGAGRGIGRGTQLFAFVGAPGVMAVGEIDTFDLAGNRAADALTFAGTTTSRPFEPAQPTGCSTSGAPGLAAIALLQAVRMLRAMTKR